MILFSVGIGIALSAFLLWVFGSSNKAAARLMILAVTVMVGAFIASGQIKTEKTVYEFPCDNNRIEFYYERGNPLFNMRDDKPKVLINGEEF